MTREGYESRCDCAWTAARRNISFNLAKVLNNLRKVFV